MRAKKRQKLPSSGNEWKKYACNGLVVFLALACSRLKGIVWLLDGLILK
jgi:hypothetical protein